MTAPPTHHDASRFGSLYLVPAPLDFGCDRPSPITDVLPLGTLTVAARLQHWVCENAKTARAVIKRIGEALPLAAPIQQHQITELPHEVHKKGDHVGSGFDARSLLQAALRGHDVGLLSEAGMPAVADPGSSVVRAAHALGIRVVPLVGPCSLLLALAASGLNGQNFAFVGYIPTDTSERQQRIRELESLALKTGQSQLFIETPYRNTALWNALLGSLQSNTALTLASGLTLDAASIVSQRVQAHKKLPAPTVLTAPCVFGIGR